MSHLGTRLRRIRIDGRTFVWLAEIRSVQGSREYHRCIRVRAWGAGKTGQALQADLLSLAWPVPWSWTACGTVDGSHPTPAGIRSLISHALESGWQPDLVGGTFVLSEREHAACFSLPGLVLTDRLLTPESADPTARVIQAYEAAKTENV